MRKSYFENVNCIEDLKSQYFTLAKMYHSDINGGSDEEMKAINAEYSELFKRYKDIHKSTREDKEEPYYTAAEATSEGVADFINIISALMKLKGLNVELCGRWLWIGGDTKTNKDALKAAGCKWSPKKKLWSWHFPEEGTTWRRKNSTMDNIRGKYGSLHIDLTPDPPKGTQLSFILG